MKQLHKFRSIYFLYCVLTAAIFYAQTWKTAAAGMQVPDFRSPLTTKDTTKPVLRTDSAGKNTIVITDTTRLPGRDTSLPRVDTFSLKISKDSLDAPVKYEAADSAVVLIKDKKI